MSSLTSAGMRGRPILPRDLQVQYSRQPLRCQRSTVSGLTINRCRPEAGQRRSIQTHKTRSRRLSRGVGLVRRATWSWWRRTRFSRARSHRDRNPTMRLRTKRKRSSCIRQDSNPAAWHAARRSGPTIAALRAPAEPRHVEGSKSRQVASMPLPGGSRVFEAQVGATRLTQIPLGGAAPHRAASRWGAASLWARPQLAHCQIACVLLRSWAQGFVAGLTGCGGAKVNLQGLVGLLPSYCRLGRSATSSHVRLRFKPGLASGARRRMPPISPFA